MTTSIIGQRRVICASSPRLPARAGVAAAKRAPRYVKCLSSSCASAPKYTVGFAKASAPAPEAVKDNSTLINVLIVAACSVVAFLVLKVLRSIFGNLFGGKKADAPASSGRATAAPTARGPAAAEPVDVLAQHVQNIQTHYPNALGADDWLSRVEVMLAAFGFRGDNSLALTNVCRDESTSIVKEKIDAIYGQAFNTNGLGGVMTCGVTGVKAGLSHAPIDEKGRERYIFFAMPHIAIDDAGKLQAIHRPGRSGESTACGALIFALGQFQSNGHKAYLGTDGVHDAKEPEGSIILHRLAKQVDKEGADVKKMDIAQFTALAERMIRSDLEALIEGAVDTSKADYAVITGIQIHSWPEPGSGKAAMELIEPASSYVVIDGKKSEIELTKMANLTARQIALLSMTSPQPASMGAALSGSTVTAVEQTDPAAEPKLMFNVPGNSPKQQTVPSWASRFATCDTC
eukprot:TRINITY_DN5174_c1_g1_i1.p1 TRINITY_DN5174_c1_g1~~TRINITY_DN5174_c1_g1_i1.p1  ORF type:complete len:499 (-),score=81.53 TRINITY_DN5174_c1_g1_i1:334-1713(-)